MASPYSVDQYCVSHRCENEEQTNEIERYRAQKISEESRFEVIRGDLLRIGFKLTSFINKCSSEIKRNI